MQISLYEFSLGARVWRYTSNTEDVVDGDGAVWEATTVSNSRIRQSGEAVADAMSVTISRDTVPAQLWRLTPPTQIMRLRVISAELAKPEILAGDYGVQTTPDLRVHPVDIVSTRYVGEIAQYTEEEPGTIVFSVETLAATMSRAGLRLGWQRQCPYALYDSRTCRVDKTLHKVDATVLSVAGSLVYLTSLGGVPANHFAAGLLEYNHPIKGLETLSIELSEFDSVTIFGYTVDLWPGSAVSLYPGCDQTPARCAFFGNYDNYGGVPAMPGKSPFDGVDNPIF